ncbi:MAG TPA: hypothetical protein VGR37_07985 [Longimicrobiaceae bacterium]|nr:hypothetical protein [Longimicrobiaceae bacterium]
MQEQQQYEVDVVYRVTVRYAVSAPDRGTAERMAREMWQAEEDGVGGTEICELESVQVAGAVDEDECGQDCDQVYRFLRDRELVIERLDEDAFNPTIHDAVSAEEVARHLGWDAEDGTLDLPRAMRVLERLCEQHRVVCFSRPRVRRGERGEIRLYCTPQHLERLSALFVEPELEADPDTLAQPGPEAGVAAEPAAAGQPEHETV